MFKFLCTVAEASGRAGLKVTTNGGVRADWLFCGRGFKASWREMLRTRSTSRGGSRISKGGVDGRPYLLRGARENALTKKIGNNFSCTCLRRVF